MIELAIILAIIGGVLVIAAFIVYDGMGYMLAAIAFILAAAVFGAIGSGQAEGRARAAFMTQCLQDHKEYECVAMWRAGEDHTNVVPMPVIVR